MARINTQELLRDFIKRRLGAPLLKVELTEDMLNDCIDRAVEVYSEYGYDGCTQETLLVDLIPGQLDRQ